LRDLKLALVDRYNNWLQRLPDEVEHEHLPAEAAALEAQGAAATNPPDYMFSEAEAVKRMWQLQQLQAQDNVEGTQRKIAAAATANPPDYTFSRTLTNVVSDTFPPEDAIQHHKSPSGTIRCGAIAFLLLALVW
jgi:hypothetical protein